MRKIILFLWLATGVSQAQLKLGNNPTTKNVNSILEMEHTTKGMLLPRVSLTSTTSYSPLSSAIVAGFLVYNTNASATAGSSSYPINSGGTGLYYWDGSGWVAVKVADALSRANNLSDLANAGTARINMGVAIGTNVQAYDADLDDLADGTLSASKVGAGLNAANIADGSVTSTEFQYINSLSSNAQTQIDGKQPLNSNLTTLGSLTPTSDNFIYSVAGAWASRTVAQVKSLLAYTKSDIGLSAVENTALSTWAGTSNITTLGTVGTGVWNATAIGLSKGGSGQTTAQAAMNTFAGAVTNGLFLRGNGANVVMGAIQAADLPTGIDAAKLADGSVTSTELQSINSVTGNVQTQLDTKADKKITTNRQTASYTLALMDEGKLVEMNVASANNLTIPPNSSVAFPVGTQILFAQYGVGQVTIVAGAGVTIRASGAKLKLTGQYSAATGIKIGSDEWYVFGDLTN